MKIADFVHQYDIILFDMDGVITSEQRYWDASALTVYQFLTDSTDVEGAMENVASIRREIFCNDKTIMLLKDKGVNSNWDLTYVVCATAKALGTVSDFEGVYRYLNDLNLNALELYQYLSEKSIKRQGREYDYFIQLFQEWYLGSTKAFELNGITPSIHNKPGLLDSETPILPVETIRLVLAALNNAGKSLGIGTGRSAYEIDGPLDKWGIRRYFDPDRLVTYTNIEQDEKRYPDAVLTKPHPYMFLKGMLGLGYDTGKIIDGSYDRALAKKTLVVGDAGADLLSARSGDLDFAAVLTGVSGKKSRGYFEENNAEYILDDITFLLNATKTPLL